MKLTEKRAAAFSGGDLKIENIEGNYLYRGSVESVMLVGKNLKVKLEWLAINDGGPSNPTETWTSSFDKSCSMNLSILTANESRGQIVFCTDNGETVVLSPPSGYKLSRNRVKGL